MHLLLQGGCICSLVSCMVLQHAVLEALHRTQRGHSWTRCRGAQQVSCLLQSADNVDRHGPQTRELAARRRACGGGACGGMPYGGGGLPSSGSCPGRGSTLKDCGVGTCTRSGVRSCLPLHLPHFAVLPHHFPCCRSGHGINWLSLTVRATAPGQARDEHTKRLCDSSQDAASRASSTRLQTCEGGVCAGRGGVCDML